MHILSVIGNSTTVSKVVPNVLFLHSHLAKWKIEAKWCKPLVSALDTSPQKRFQGIFINCGLKDGDSGGVSYPFDEMVYIIVIILDPMYRLLWVDHFISDSERASSVKRSLKGTFSISTELFCTRVNQKSSGIAL